MAEITEDHIISKISVIDAEIDKIIAVLGSSGQGAVQFLDYKIGSKSVDGSTRLKQLQEARTMYQGLLRNIPKTITRDHGQSVEPLTGADHTQLVGDE